MLSLKSEDTLTPISEKQLAANRANAARSTGPRTAQGKARSAQNARSHGFTASTFAVVRLEDLDEIARLTADLTAVYRPGHAKLRTRWPLYGIGMVAAAIWPVRAELRFLGGGEFKGIGMMAVVAALVHSAGRRWALSGPPEIPDDDVGHDEDEATVLNIGQVIRRQDPDEEADPRLVLEISGRGQRGERLAHRDMRYAQISRDRTG